MTSDHEKQFPSLEEIYALIDENRVAAAKAAQFKFHGMMESGITAITSIGTIAGSRVQTDSHIASRKVLINAELASARLLAEAEALASTWANHSMTEPKNVVEAALEELGKQTGLRLMATAKEAVEMIQQDADAAIKVLRETGGIAICELQTIAVDAAEQTKREATLAAEKLKEYRKEAHTTADATPEGEDLAQIIITAAEVAAVKLQESMKAILGNINDVTEAACLAVHEAALASKKKIEEGLEGALAKLHETLKSQS